MTIVDLNEWFLSHLWPEVCCCTREHKRSSVEVCDELESLDVHNSQLIDGRVTGKMFDLASCVEVNGSHSDMSLDSSQHLMNTAVRMNDLLG